MEVCHGTTTVDGDIVSVSLSVRVPKNLIAKKIQVAVTEQFYFNRHSPFAGVQNFLETKISEKREHRELQVSTRLTMAQYAAAFYSLNSSPWACLPLRVTFHGGHPDILVLGLATPRYVRGDIRSGILHTGAPDPKRGYYQMAHKNVRPGMVELARFLDDQKTVVSVVRSSKPIAFAERLLAGELFVLLRYLVGLRTWFQRRGKIFSVPVYSRTALLYEQRGGAMDVMSTEKKLDLCGILHTPFLAGEGV